MVDRGVAESGRHAAGLPEASRGEVVIRRTSTGWRVEGAFPALPTDTVDDLGHALVLADLLAEGTVPGSRPPRPPGEVDEVTQLRAAVRQLEHALTSRVVVEQAIGVLSERWRVAPRDAFEQLRRVTRSHGLRIHDLAKQVIESSADPAVTLPAELVPQQRVAEVQRPAGPVRPADQGQPERPPEPRRSPDGRGPGEGRPRRGRSGEPVPAQANGQRSSVTPMQAAAPAPRTAAGRHAQSAH